MAQDILEYCNGHNLTNIDMIGHSMGKLRCFCNIISEMVDKLIIADIAPKLSPQHQSILGGLNSRFSKKPSDLKWKKSLLLTYQMWEPDSFNEKLVLGRARAISVPF
jgi:hypothetical protein